MAGFSTSLLFLLTLRCVVSQCNVISGFGGNFNLTGRNITKETYIDGYEGHCVVVTASTGMFPSYVMGSQRTFIYQDLEIDDPIGFLSIHNLMKLHMSHIEIRLFWSEGTRHERAVGKREVSIVDEIYEVPYPVAKNRNYTISWCRFQTPDASFQQEQAIGVNKDKYRFHAGQSLFVDGTLVFTKKYPQTSFVADGWSFLSDDLFCCPFRAFVECDHDPNRGRWPPCQWEFEDDGQYRYWTKADVFSPLLVSYTEECVEEFFQTQGESNPQWVTITVIVSWSAFAVFCVVSVGLGLMFWALSIFKVCKDGEKFKKTRKFAVTPRNVSAAVDILLIVVFMINVLIDLVGAGSPVIGIIFSCFEIPCLLVAWLPFAVNLWYKIEIRSFGKIVDKYWDTTSSIEHIIISSVVVVYSFLGSMIDVPDVLVISLGGIAVGVTLLGLDNLVNDLIHGSLFVEVLEKKEGLETAYDEDSEKFGILEMLSCGFCVEVVLILFFWLVGIGCAVGQIVFSVTPPRYEYYLLSPVFVGVGEFVFNFSTGLLIKAILFYFIGVSNDRGKITRGNYNQMYDLIFGFIFGIFMGIKLIYSVVVQIFGLIYQKDGYRYITPNTLLFNTLYTNIFNVGPIVVILGGGAIIGSIGAIIKSSEVEIYPAPDEP